MQCEDFPCCGHTDGLGCDWVSPNEITLCMVCADARKSAPYHDGHSCPTKKEQENAELLEDATCEDCENEEADTVYDGSPLCWSCFAEAENAELEWREYASDQLA